MAKILLSPEDTGTGDMMPAFKCSLTTFHHYLAGVFTSVVGAVTEAFIDMEIRKRQKWSSGTVGTREDFLQRSHLHWILKVGVLVTKTEALSRCDNPCSRAST